MATIACPICGGADFVATRGAAADPRLAGGRSLWAICKGCGLVLQNPRPTDDVLAQLYSRHEYHAHNDPLIDETLEYALRRPRPLMRYLEGFIGQPGKVIDIGCGLGGAVLAFKLRGWEAHGVEPDPKLARIAQELGLDVRAEFFDESSFTDVAPNLIYTCHAFEHFTAPLDVARAARARLSDGGLLFVCVPTFRHARTWAREWLNASHTFIFTDRTLGNLLFRAGFEQLAYRYHSAEGELWLVASTAETPPAGAALPFHEDWRSVRRELALTVPARSASWWVQRRLARNAHHLGDLLLDPSEFGRGFSRMIARRRVRRTREGTST